MGYAVEITSDNKTSYRTLRAKSIAEALDEASSRLRSWGRFESARILDGVIPVQQITADDKVDFDYLELEFTAGSWRPV